MRNFKLGTILSLVIFIVLTITNWKIYNNVMSLSVMIPLLVAHVFAFRSLVTNQRIITYLLFIVGFIICLVFSLPEISYKQAKEEVEKKYQLSINTEGIAPILVNQWNPFLSDTGYLFIGENAEKLKMTILVDPNTGKLIEIN